MIVVPKSKLSEREITRKVAMTFEVNLAGGKQADWVREELRRSVISCLGTVIDEDTIQITAMLP